MARLPEHDHCEYCGDAVPFDRRFCTEECAGRWLRERKEERRRNVLFYGVVAASLLSIAAAAVLLNI